MLENTHCDLEGLLRTMRSDPMERTGVSVNVKPLTVSRLLRHCTWSLKKLAIGVDGLTRFSNVNVVRTILARQCFLERPSAIEYQFEFNLRWNHDGKQMVCSWEKMDLYH